LEECKKERDKREEITKKERKGKRKTERNMRRKY
jgi:tmRNA-binding protein